MGQAGAGAQILFVYNADGTLLARAADAVHKIVAPASYPCSLCSLSHGALKMRRDWPALLAGLPLPAQVLHRDEFAAAFGDHAFPWPAVLLHRGKAMEELVGAAQLGRLPDLPALDAAVRRELAARGIGVSPPP